MVLGKVDSIIINNGNINAFGSTHEPAIGGTDATVQINGGNITCQKVNAWQQTITLGGKKLVIKGGKLTVLSGGSAINNLSTACEGQEVIIYGGTIKTSSLNKSGISCTEGGNIKIIGGNILARGKNNLNVATYEEGTSNLIKYIPNNGTNNIYETQIKLQNVEANKKIESITTSDGIEYGIKDMNTLEDGMLYLYLPLGNREITIKVDGKTYKGEVETKEEENVTVLSEE